MRHIKNANLLVNKPNFSVTCLLFRTETMVKSCTCHFKLNEEFKETTIDDRQVESIIFFEDIEDQEETEGEKKKRLVHLQTDKQGRRAKIERVIDSDGVTMKVTMTVNDVKAAAVFRKVVK